MLVSIVLTLVAESVGKPAAHWGRANYSETLQRLNQTSAGLGDAVHQIDGPKPLTCSSLFGRFEQRAGNSFVRPGEQYWLRLTGLQTAVSEALLAGFWQNRPSHWRVNGNTFQVINADCRPDRHPWSDSSSYEKLAEQHLLGETSRPQLEQVTLEFASPTAFRKNEMNMPLPLPSLVFGSLVDRWNRFSSVTLSEQVRNFGELAVEINQFALNSVRVEQKNDGLRFGCVGTARYRAFYHDRYWLGLFQLLADFALYSGVGVQTAAGMGQVRRVRENH